MLCIASSSCLSRPSAGVFVCRQLGASSAFQSAAVFAHVLQIILLAYPGNEIFMLLVMPIFHSGVWVFMPWLLWAALNDSRSGRAGLFVLTALLALSDLIVVPWFVGPFFVAVGMAWWQGGFSSKRALESSAIVAFGDGDRSLVVQFVHAICRRAKTLPTFFPSKWTPFSVIWSSKGGGCWRWPTNMDGWQSFGCCLRR